MTQPACNCLRLLKQAADCVAILALASAGKSMPARTIMIAITTNSSIKVNPLLDLPQRQQRKSEAFIPILSFDRRFEKPHKSEPPSESSASPSALSIMLFALEVSVGPFGSRSADVPVLRFAAVQCGMFHESSPTIKRWAKGESFNKKEHSFRGASQDPAPFKFFL